MSVRRDDEPSHEGENEAQPRPEPDKPLPSRCYEICIGAQLDASWSEWFEGLEMHQCGNGWTILRGPVADQAALLGILNKLSRLNLPLVSVNEIKGDSRPDARQEGGD